MLTAAMGAELPLAIWAPNIEECLTKFVAAVPTGPTDRARDRELLARVARGDVAALRSLYDQHAPRAITIAFRILRNREEAEAMSPVAPPTPVLEVERRRDERRVAAALGALPPAQRRTIELAYFEGLSQSEIAAKTDCPLGTVKMRVKLAMAKLAALLGDEST